MGKATRNASDSFASRLAKFRDEVTKIRDAQDNGRAVSQAHRDSVRDLGGKLLADVQASELPQAGALGKKIRQNLRKLGHYISKRGKPWLATPTTKVANANANATPKIKAKRTRKTKIATNATPTPTPTPTPTHTQAEIDAQSAEAERMAESDA